MTVYNWIAVDDDGEVWEFEVKPTKDMCCWMQQDRNYRRISHGTAQPDTWHDSLRQTRRIRANSHRRRPFSNEITATINGIAEVLV